MQALFDGTVTHEGTGSNLAIFYFFLQLLYSCSDFLRRVTIDFMPSLRHKVEFRLRQKFLQFARCRLIRPILFTAKQ